jgi:hypothetical protein
VLDVRYTAACKHMNAKLPVRQRVPLRVIMPGRLPAASAVDRAVHLDGKSAVQVPYDEALNVKGPFTFEAWFRVESLGGRVGAMNRTESSSYGLFFAEADTPQLKLIIHDAQARRYAEAKNDTERPPVGHWFHVACTYNGVTMAVWLDGKKIVEADAPKEITPNTLPMYLGADVLGNGEPISFLNGEIDEFRLSNVCRYTAAFEPAKRFETDEHTLVLYHLDRAFVNTVVDSSGNGLHGIVVGNAVFDAHADVD